MFITVVVASLICSWFEQTLHRWDHLAINQNINFLFRFSHFKCKLFWQQQKTIFKLIYSASESWYLYLDEDFVRRCVNYPHSTSACIGYCSFAFSQWYIFFELLKLHATSNEFRAAARLHYTVISSCWRSMNFWLSCEQDRARFRIRGPPDAKANRL